MTIRTLPESGARFYYDTENPGTRVPGVTSIVGMLPKPALQYWSARLAAELAVDTVDTLPGMVQRDRQGAIDYLKGAAPRYTKERGRIGSEAHDLFERMARGETIGRTHPDMVPYHRHFGEFLDELQPELVFAEDVVWSDAHAYAGSFDAIMRLRLDDNGWPDPHGDPALVLMDYKTSREVYPAVALQLAAYGHADWIVSAVSGAEATPMPTLDGACVLHVTPAGWEFFPVHADENTFAYFLHLREIFRWEHEVSRGVIGRPIAQHHDALITGTQRRGR